MDHPHHDDPHHHDDQKAFPFEKVARLDAPERHQRQPVAPVLEALHLTGDEVVLDLGVGTGFHALPLAERLSGGGKVLGADIEPRMLELFTERAGEAGLTEQVEAVTLDPDSPRLPVPDGAADRALLVNVYHELPDRPASLAELHRLLREGGEVLVVDWDAAGSTEHGPPVRHRVPTATARAELEAAGFGELEELPLFEAYFFALRARR